jgi:hypothetical protein
VSEEAESRFEPVLKRAVSGAPGGSYGEFDSRSQSEHTTAFGRCNGFPPFHAIYLEQSGAFRHLITALSLNNCWGFLRCRAGSQMLRRCYTPPLIK